jgi:hypothetical protein
MPLARWWTPPSRLRSPAPAENSAFQVIVEIEEFAPRMDGAVVMLVQWRVLGEGGRRVLAGQRVSLADRAEASNDAAIAATMTREVDNLAALVAAGLNHVSSQVRPTRPAAESPSRRNIRGLLLHSAAIHHRESAIPHGTHLQELQHEG